MSKEPEVFLQDILESIQRIEEYIQGITRGEFLADRKTQDSVFRNFEIIGEAVKNLPQAFKEKFNHIPWKRVANMRDLLIHEYFDVDNKIVWDTIKNDLPEFKKEIKKLLK